MLMLWCRPMVRPQARTIRLAVLAITIALDASARGQESPPATVVTVAVPAHRDRLFVGYGSEPAMDFGGRTVASLQDGISRLFGRTDVAKEHPGLAPAWEFPTAATLIL